MSIFEDPKIIVALDYSDSKSAFALVDTLDPTLCRLKVGKGMFTRFGPDFVKQLIKRNFAVFLDLKFHDIPHQVAIACEAAADLGVWMLSLHALGGSKMLTAARNSLEKFVRHKPLLVGITLLTSMNDQDAHEVGLSGDSQTIVKRLAKLAQAAGLDGVVCSPQEVALVRQLCGEQFCLVTPGIRLQAAKAEDQQRIMTPAAALAAGANYLVIGRPITEAPDPLKVLQEIRQQIVSS